MHQNGNKLQMTLSANGVSTMSWCNGWESCAHHVSEVQWLVGLQLQTTIQHTADNITGPE